MLFQNHLSQCLQEVGLDLCTSGIWVPIRRFSDDISPSMMHIGPKGYGCHDKAQNSKIGMLRHLDTHSTTQMAQVMVKH